MNKFTKDKKKVLMLDNEPLMIDRRIILEAQTLVNSGYHVVIATKMNYVKAHKEFERGIEIRRFPINTDTDFDPKFEILNLINNCTRPNLEQKVAKRLSILPRKTRMFIYAFCFPPLMAGILRNRFPGIKLRLGYYFEPLVFSMMLRPKFLMPYFRLVKARLKKADKKEYIAKTGILEEKIQLDLFEEQILQYAKTEFRPDIVHAHDLPNLTLGIVISKYFGIPLIYDAHELYPLQFFSENATRDNLAKKEAKLIKHVNAVVAVNQQCKHVLENTYSAVKDTVILSNATENPQNFDPSVKTRLWHQKFHLEESVQLMVFQGGINPVRNIDQLMYALQKVPEHIHAGFITFAKDIAYYQALTSTLRISHRVHYVIEIPWDQVIYWLAAADVGIMPYQASNMNAKISSPNKLFEFIVAGLPVIGSSELDNVRMAIEKYNIGICEFLKEPDSYVNAINRMFDPKFGGPARFQQNVLNARPFFTWDNEEPKLLDLYARLLPVKESAECVA